MPRTAKTPKHYCGYAQATCKSLANMPACSLRLCPESPPLRPETGLWPVSTVTSFLTVDLCCFRDRQAGLLEVVGAHEQFKLCSNGTVRGLRKCTSGEGAAVNAFSRLAAQRSQTTSQSKSLPDNPRDPPDPGPCTSRRCSVSARLASGTCPPYRDKRAQDANSQPYNSCSWHWHGLFASFNFEAVGLPSMPKLRAVTSYNMPP